MSDDPFNNRPDGPSRRNQDPQFNWRGFLLFALAITLLISGFMMNKGMTGSRKVFDYAEFKRHVEADRIDPNKPLNLVSSSHCQPATSHRQAKRQRQSLHRPV